MKQPLSSTLYERGIRARLIKIPFPPWYETRLPRCNSTSNLEWQNVSVRGRKPARRYGHSMVALDTASGDCDYAKMVVFGGTTGGFSELEEGCK